MRYINLHFTYLLTYLLTRPAVSRGLRPRSQGNHRESLNPPIKARCVDYRLFLDDTDRRHIRKSG